MTYHTATSLQHYRPFNHTFYHHHKIATSAIRKTKKRYQSSHHVSDAWPQQVTLVLKILNETVDK